ncbi:hypothetical protein M405DRAFT_832097 [Rhizopogon salebrosus TDB-379]|nr:hypothetical protein M405DRAFT_832097 [Rhizopogon salebrosus TDB-379]
MGPCLFVLIIASCTKTRSSERFPECFTRGKRFHSIPNSNSDSYSKEQLTIDASSFKPLLSSNQCFRVGARLESRDKIRGVSLLVCSTM